MFFIKKTVKLNSQPTQYEKKPKKIIKKRKKSYRKIL
jgi:hypothetical protein